MGLSKSSRIQILLAIDTAFFLLELIVGYAVHSLALVADAFHMLNDVLSLCVGLWAVKVANKGTKSKMYTYGWQRAETLGALINGVFLVALCVSIFLEAIQRFVEPQEVSFPKLILIVGCFGLASNIIGLFLFHEHSHSHGEGAHGHSHDHAHGHADELSEAEEGHGHNHPVNGIAKDPATADIADEGGNVADVLPQNRIGGWPTTKPKRMESGQSDDASSRTGARRRSIRHHSRSASRSYQGLDEIYVHPSSFRNNIISASRLEDVESGSGSGSASDNETEQAVAGDENGPTEQSPLLRGAKGRAYSESHKGHKHGAVNGDANGEPISHHSHKHAQPQEPGKKGGHSHSDLNMKGVFLHVLGDALGNIGVIATALFIWLTNFSWRFYADPVVSLVITVIILCSAIPLCKAASRILLQAVPAGISVDDIIYDITELPGILSCHHLHVWQLSDTKLVASLHVEVGFDFKGEGSARYMKLARAIRRCLHDYGIHSSTIQPEFNLDPSQTQAGGSGETDSCDETGPTPPHGPSQNGSKPGSKSGSVRETRTCLLECGDACGNGKQCCAPSSVDGVTEE